MADSHLTAVVRQIRAMVTKDAFPDATDGELLERFRVRRDEEAFAALMLRHGPMVLRVAQRVLECGHDAEDIFQAAFLLLARKAGSIRKRESVSSWLHGVAHRLALEAKAQMMRRQERERRAASMSRSPTNRQAAWQELEEALDQALARVPATYREALVLCCLEGKTQEEAARQLGCPLGTVRSRLARGREVLRKQLDRLGVTLSAGAFGTFLAATGVNAAVPPTLFVNTLRAVLPQTLGTAAGAVSVKVASLVEGAAKAMLISKTKIVACLVGVTLLAAGAGLCAHRALLANNPPLKDHVAEETRPDLIGGRDGQAKTAPKVDSATVDVHGDPLPYPAVARMGTVRFRHGGAVIGVAYSPDGRLLASGSYDGTARIWDASTGKELHRFKVSDTGIHGVSFTPDGKGIIALGGDSTIYHWKIATGELQGMIARNTGCFAVSPDGRAVISAELGEMNISIRVRDLAGKELRRLEGPKKRVAAVAFSPDGQRAACLAGDGIYLWDTATGKTIRTVSLELTMKSIPVGGLVFSPDGKTLAGGLPDKTVRLWNVATGKELHQLSKHQKEVETVAFSPDGRWLASGSLDQSVIIWETESGKQLRRLQGFHTWVTTVAFARDGKTLATGSHENVIRLWDPATGREIPPVEGHQHWVRSVALAPDGKTLATSGLDRSIRLWETATGKKLRRLEGHRDQVSCVVFTADGKTLISGSRDKSIRFWDTGTGKEVRRFEQIRYPVHDLALSPDGKTLASGGGGYSDQKGGEVLFWDLATGKPSLRLEGLRGNIQSIGFSSDGKMFASAEADDRTVYLWDLATGKELRRLHGHKMYLQTIRFSPDGRVLASAGVLDGICLWDIASGQLIWRLDRPRAETRQLREIYGLSFSPDGKTLASGEIDNVIWLWEVATGKRRQRLDGHQGSVMSVAFSENGRYLASGGMDTAALLWDRTQPANKADLAFDQKAAPSWDTRWGQLGSEDGVLAYEAVLALVRSPENAIPLCKKRLRPVPRSDSAHVQKLITDLASSEFATRQKAFDELQKLGESAQPSLEKALQDKRALETRRRIEKLLQGLTAKRLLSVRALEALEVIATPEAHQIIDSLARGLPGAGLTREAQAALGRLDRRGVR